MPKENDFGESASGLWKSETLPSGGVNDSFWYLVLLSFICKNTKGEYIVLQSFEIENETHLTDETRDDNFTI